MDKFETERLRLKIGFAVFAILLPVVLPILAPSVGIHEDGKIPLNALQVLYAVLSVELVMAVYMWGVGNWSRYEPPHGSTPPAPPAGDLPQVGGAVNATPNSPNTGALTRGGA
jgi:hypothetical protein